MLELDLDDVARCGAPGCPRLPVHGRLCRVHGDQLGQWLAEIRTDLRELLRGLKHGVDERSAPAADAASGRRGTKVKSKGSPVNLDAVAITDRRIAWLTDDDVDDLVDVVGRDSTPRALEVLAWWAGLIRDGRGLPWPTRTLPLAAGPACAGRCWHLSCAAARDGIAVEVPAITAETERQLIVDELPWCLRQEWAGRLWRSIRQLWAALKAARGSDEGRPVAVCRRPAFGPAGGYGETCGGRVYAERGAGWCARCAHTWTGRELLELTRRGVAA